MVTFPEFPGRTNTLMFSTAYGDAEDTIHHPPQDLDAIPQV
ncbi:hypothetical protein [Streptomyces sp. AC555_RSS877]|nr:hypothetical protein [Streptomyces sp. AC555_RSS877]